MAVTEGNLPVGDTGEKLDTTVVEQTDGTEVHREVVVVGDPEKLANLANVVETVRRSRLALLVSDENTGAIYGALEMIIQQNEEIKMLLTSMAE